MPTQWAIPILAEWWCPRDLIDPKGNDQVLGFINKGTGMFLRLVWESYYFLTPNYGSWDKTGEGGKEFIWFLPHLPHFWKSNLEPHSSLEGSWILAPFSPGLRRPCPRLSGIFCHVQVMCQVNDGDRVGLSQDHLSWPWGQRSSLGKDGVMEIVWELRVKCSVSFNLNKS